MTSAAPARKPYRKAPPQHRETRQNQPIFQEDLTESPTATCDSPAQAQLASSKESVSDAEKVKILQQQNEDLRRHLTHTTHKMEAMEEEFESRRHYMQTEMSRTRDDLEKMKDKFRRLQNSYTASQRTNQDLEEKLHALAAINQTWVHAVV